MLVNLTLVLFALACHALAVPTSPRLAARVLPQNWTITKFRSFEASPGPEGVSDVSFGFSCAATNTTAQCGRSIPAGSGSSAVDPDHFYSCDNGDVGFKFGGDWLAIVLGDNMGNGTSALEIGNITLNLLCYNMTDHQPLVDGSTCESATGFFVMPMLNATLVTAVANTTSVSNPSVADNGTTTDNSTGSIPPTGPVVPTLGPGPSLPLGANFTDGNNLTHHGNSTHQPHGNATSYRNMTYDQGNFKKHHQNYTSTDNLTQGGNFPQGTKSGAPADLEDITPAVVSTCGS